MLSKTNKANAVIEMPLKVIENSQSSGIQKDLHLQLKMKFQKSLEPTDLNFITLIFGGWLRFFPHPLQFTKLTLI